MSKNKFISGCSLGFDLLLADILGLHAAVVFSNIYHLWKHATTENLEAACSGYLEKEEVLASLIILNSNNLISFDKGFIVIIEEGLE